MDLMAIHVYLIRTGSSVGCPNNGMMGRVVVSPPEPEIFYGFYHLDELDEVHGFGDVALDRELAMSFLAKKYTPGSGRAPKTARCLTYASAEEGMIASASPTCRGA
jgi:hypothetical protein